MVHCIHLGVTGYNFLIRIAFLSLKMIFVLANSVDPDEIPLYVTFHQFVLILHLLSSVSSMFAKIHIKYTKKGSGSVRR